MKASELLLYGVAGWCGMGAIGVAISMARGRRAEARKHSVWIAAVAGIYFVILLSVSLTQRERTIAIGQDQCFDKMCFAVVGVDEVPGLMMGDDSRVVRVTIRVANRGSASRADEAIAAYIADSHGRVWQQLPGLSGNRLNARVASGGQMVSQPMFRVDRDAEGLGLVLTHGNWQPRRLLIGDSDSLGHRRTPILLGR